VEVVSRWYDEFWTMRRYKLAHAPSNFGLHRSVKSPMTQNVNFWFLTRNWAKACKGRSAMIARPILLLKQECAELYQNWNKMDDADWNSLA
jgi:hypothetical protein